jgi:hypothetical protein
MRQINTRWLGNSVSESGIPPFGMACHSESPPRISKDPVVPVGGQGWLQRPENTSPIVCLYFDPHSPYQPRLLKKAVLRENCLWCTRDAPSGRTLTPFALECTAL